MTTAELLQKLTELTTPICDIIYNSEGQNLERHLDSDGRDKVATYREAVHAVLKEIDSRKYPYDDRSK